MKLFRKVVDERQELEAMRIERGAYYVRYSTLQHILLCIVQYYTAHMTWIR